MLKYCSLGVLWDSVFFTLPLNPVFFPLNDYRTYRTWEFYYQRPYTLSEPKGFLSGPHFLKQFNGLKTCWFWWWTNQSGAQFNIIQHSLWLSFNIISNFCIILTCSKNFQDTGHRWCCHCCSDCARRDTSDRWTDRSGSGMTLGDNLHSWAVLDYPGTSLLGSPYSCSVHQCPGIAPEDTECSPIVLSHSGMFRVNIYNIRMSQSHW